MSKQRTRAKGIVNKALSTFTTAIKEVEKANKILSEEVEKDMARLSEIEAEIVDKYKELDVVQSEQITKESEIIGNKELIAKLKRFTK